MRILITGGFGFVGARLAVHLAQAGHQIVLGSRNAQQAPLWLPQAEVTQVQWNNTKALEHSCHDIDAVIHAAGMNAQDCAADPVAALDFNGVATARLVTVAKQVGVRRFIYLSTAHVYANPLVGDITEESCTRNLHPYATSHLAGEQAVLSTTQQGNTQGIVLRLSNAFGAPVYKEVNCWMLLVNDLCKQAVQTQRLVLHTSGLQHRDFIGMADVCRVIEHFAVAEAKSELPKLNIYNVGAGISQSVLDMALLIQERCKQVLGFEPVLQRVQTTANEQHNRLRYQVDKLQQLGIAANNASSTTEIDGLLRFCESNFSPLI
jgi:UDP-glucose 4-epimerase